MATSTKEEATTYELPDEAEAQQSEALVKIEFTPATIAGNLEAISAKVEELTKQVTNGTIDATKPDEVRWAKKSRSYVNSLQKSLSAERIRVERELMRPWEPWKEKCKDLEGQLKDASNFLKSAIDEAEEARKAQRRKVLEEEFQAYAGLLADVVSIDQIMQPEWLNKSTQEPKAIKELREKVEAVAKNWETLRTFEGQPNYDVAEREFYTSLDLGAAIEAMKNATAKDEQLRQLREQTGVGQSAPEAPQAPQMPTAEPAPKAEQTATQTAAEAPSGEEPKRAWNISIDGATRAQMQQIANYIASLGLHGSISEWQEAAA